MNPYNPTKPRRKSPDSKYGPAMAVLSPLQRRYVIQCFETPDKTDYEQIRLAGYRGKEPAAKMCVYRMKKNPLVLLAFKELGEAEYLGQIPKAVAALSGIIGNSKHRQQAKAAQNLIDRAVLPPVSETHVTHTHTVSIEDMRSQLKALLMKPAMKALLPVVSQGDTIEATESD